MLDLVRGFPDYRLVVSRVFPDARILLQAGDSGVQSLGTWYTRPMGRIPEAIFCFRRATAFLEEAESVLYSGFYAPFAVERQRHGRRVHYCSTPPRFAYDMRQFYLDRLPAPVRPAASAFFDYVKRNYEASVARMDVVIANSQNVRGRLAKFLGVDAHVVNPPIDTGRFRWIEAGDYFVSLARVTEYKQVEVIVRAFLRMPDRKLVVASGGPQEPFLRRLAADARNILFTGWMSEVGLADLIGRARAAIYLPRDEDFGMSPVEAMSAGKPVIGVAEGGLLETVVEGVTGVLVPAPPSVESVVEAVDRMTPQRAFAMREACEARARLFSKELFLGRMKPFLEGEMR
jgi:glycosyltransferase involved in cell wall biosynthesis